MEERRYVDIVGIPTISYIIEMLRALPEGTDISLISESGLPMTRRQAD